MTEKPVKTQDVADYFGLAKGTVENWRYRDVGPPHYRIGRSVYYWMSEVETWARAEGLVREKEAERRSSIFDRP